MILMKKQPNTIKNNILNSIKKIKKQKNCTNCSGNCKQRIKIEKN